MGLSDLRPSRAASSDCRVGSLLLPPPPPALLRRGGATFTLRGENVWNSVSALGSGRRFFFPSPSHQLDFPTKFCFHVPNSELWTFSSHKQHRVESNSTLVSTMASSPQKSPSSPKSPTPKSPSSRKKDDSFLGKLGGTLARRKKAKEGNKQTTAC